MKAFVSNLRMAHKFLLVAFIAAVMLAVPSTIVLRDGYAHLQAMRAETAGIAPAGAALAMAARPASGWLRGAAAGAVWRVEHCGSVDEHAVRGEHYSGVAV